MAIKYKNIVPWGRSFDEYVDMFNLTEIDLKKNILGCGDGPASFNAEATQKGYYITSADPIYQFTENEINNRINEVYDRVLSQVEHDKENYIWEKIKSVKMLGEKRMAAMRTFLKDFECGKKEKRYICAELPNLPFRDKQFDLTLCSHLIFLYTDNLSLKFHIDSIKELIRVSSEIRIFPLTDFNTEKSKYVDEIKKMFPGIIEEIPVSYKFHKNAYTMMKIQP